MLTIFTFFAGNFGHLIKILWHDGIGMSLYAKRLERGRFVWPAPVDGIVAISTAQLAYVEHPFGTFGSV